MRLLLASRPNLVTIVFRYFSEQVPVGTTGNAVPNYDTLGSSKCCLVGVDGQMNTPPTTIFINGMVADLSNETLVSSGGEKLSLRPQTFATLRFLIENANRLITKSELLEAVWHGVAVTDDSLVQCIHEIRRAIGDDAHELLQTVSKRGYRFTLPEQAGLPANRPSIAVLAFRAVGEATDENYFVDGLVEDLITSLARVPGLFVIARNSSFSFRKQEVDSRKIAAELGVRYLLDGSVRRSGDRLRVNCHLIEGATTVHVWADSFEGSAADVFDLQERLIEQIAGIVEPSIRRAEIERSRRKRPNSLDAYDLYLQALPHAHSNSPSDTEKALRYLTDSLRLDPEYMPARAYAAWCHEQRYFRCGFEAEDRHNALMHSDMALSVNCDDSNALSIAAFVRANLTRDYDSAVEILDRALAMNANSALAFGFSSLVAAHSERHARAVEHAHNALRLSPVDDPLNYHPYCALALTHLFAGEYGQSIAYGNLTIRSNPSFSVPYAYLIAAHVNQGNLAEARSVSVRLLELVPGFSINNFERMNLFRPSLMDRITAALQQVHMPE
jgi:TolB-like protein